MQSYGIIGVTLWRNGGVSTGKRQYPYVETVVSRLRNSRSPPGNGKLMYTINFCPPGELAYVRFILCCRYFICNLSAAGICNALTIYQLVYYTRLVAGADVFMFFQLYRGRITHQN